jgi:hypothetical protein
MGLITMVWGEISEESTSWYKAGHAILSEEFTSSLRRRLYFTK